MAKLSLIIILNVVHNILCNIWSLKMHFVGNYHGVQDPFILGDNDREVAWLPMLLFAHDNRKNDKNASLCEWNLTHD